MLLLPIWAIALIIVGGLLVLGIFVVVAVKLILYWLVSHMSRVDVDEERVWSYSIVILYLFV